MDGSIGYSTLGRGASQPRPALGTTLDLGQGVRKQGQLCKLHSRGRHQFWTQIWVCIQTCVCLSCLKQTPLTQRWAATGLPAGRQVLLDRREQPQRRGDLHLPGSRACAAHDALLQAWRRADASRQQVLLVCVLQTSPHDATDPLLAPAGCWTGQHCRQQA